MDSILKNYLILCNFHDDFPIQQPVVMEGSEKQTVPKCTTKKKKAFIYINKVKMVCQ